MTYAEAVQRVLDLLNRAMDLIDNAEWDTEDDPDPGEEAPEDEETEGTVVMFSGGKAL